MMHIQSTGLPRETSTHATDYSFYALFDSQFYSTKCSTSEWAANERAASEKEHCQGAKQEYGAYFGRLFLEMRVTH